MRTLILRKRKRVNAYRAIADKDNSDVVQAYDTATSWTVYSARMAPAAVLGPGNRCGACAATTR